MQLLVIHLAHAAHGVVLDPGFVFKGTITVMGYSASLHISLNIPDRFYLDAKLDAISFAGGMIELHKVGDANCGPTFTVDIEPVKQKVSNT